MSDNQVSAISDVQPSPDYLYVQELDRDSEWRTKYGFKFVTCHSITASLPCGVDVHIPAGFICDGCTKGWSKLGQLEWLIHDWLYATKGQGHQEQERQVTRKEADDVFWTWPQYHRWFAVRCFASSHWGRQPVAFDQRIQPNLLK